MNNLQRWDPLHLHEHLQHVQQGIYELEYPFLGDNFVVTDRDGEECKEVRIESATFDEKAPHVQVLFQSDARPRERRRNTVQKLPRCRPQDYRYEPI